jgi:hypothetical protein
MPPPGQEQTFRFMIRQGKRKGKERGKVGLVDGVSMDSVNMQDGHNLDRNQLSQCTNNGNGHFGRLV